MDVTNVLSTLSKTFQSDELCITDMVYLIVQNTSKDTKHRCKLILSSGGSMCSKHFSKEACWDRWVIVMERFVCLACYFRSLFLRYISVQARDVH